MKKQFISATLILMLLFVRINYSWANLPAPAQKEQQNPAKKAEVAEKSIADNKVSYGTLPVFNFLLGATINAFKKTTVKQVVKKEEACVKSSKLNQKEGAC